MSQPEISIILPAYNAEKYIAETISSLLSQTFENFELLILDDGSTDNTIAVIKNFNDSRIQLIENAQNLGLIRTLNKAAALCKGRYTARMDADDIALPNRLQLQKNYLDKNEKTAAIAGWIIFIDEAGTQTGIWELDRKTNTAPAIKKALLKENCVAHPTVMIRTEILQQYLYKENQQNIEDYDLWLRLTAAGLPLEKVQEPVLLYRVHNNSVTVSKLKKNNFFFLHFKCKLKFLLGAFKQSRINGFTVAVFFSMIKDLLMGFGKAIKKIVSS
jgi:glycosyltransferase involved in cell wall biosynthesis